MDSKLQIISGKFKGRKLFLPSCARPSQNRARIAIFNMLESGLFNFNRDFIVWDAFAGSGAFGIECLSRYPHAKVIFTDISDESMIAIKRNTAALNVSNRIEIVRADSWLVAEKYGKMADLVFLDAPFAAAELGLKIVRKLSEIAKNGTVVIWEQEDRYFSNPPGNSWRILRDKKYGRARFLILGKFSE